MSTIKPDIVTQLLEENWEHLKAAEYYRQQFEQADDKLCVAVVTLLLMTVLAVIEGVWIWALKH